MLTSPAEIIRESITMPTLARFYGFNPNRAGFITCPFHGEKTPSLKLYPIRWRCFGCNEGGDAVDFVRRLTGLDFPAVIAQISGDFGLGISNDKPDAAALARIRRERAERERAKKEREQTVLALIARRRAAWEIIQSAQPQDEPTDEWILAINELDYLDYQIDRLTG